MSEMRPKPDVSDFIDGAERTTEPAEEGISVMITAPFPTVQKIFRLRWDTAALLKAEAQRRSSKEGRRVSETEIVEAWIRKGLKA